MNQTDRSDKLITVIKNSRDLIKYIVDLENDVERSHKALMFIYMLQSLQELTAALVDPENEDKIEAGIQLLDDAISRLESDADEDFMKSYGGSGAPFNPNSRGDA